MDSNTIKDLIEKHLNSTATPEEEANLMTWYTTVEDSSYTANLSPSKKAELAESMLTEIRKRTGQTPSSHTKPYRPVILWKWSAAAALILALTGHLVIQQSDRPVLLHTAFGEVKTVVLSDSSEIMLNGNSTIKLGDNDRELWLEGEAFFHIKKKADKQRFVVHVADTLSIEVLGTEFNVQQRKSGTSIALKSGKIRLYRNYRNGALQTVDMEPNDIVYLKQQLSKGMEKSTVKNLEQQLAWRQQKLHLEDTPLSQIIETLEETYGIRATVSTDTILQRSATGSMPIDPAYPERALNNIAELYNLSLTTNQVPNMNTEQLFILKPR